jgi:hypothetical protein
MRALKVGVAYQSSSADYAEWLERLKPEEEVRAGDVVGVFGGKISKTTKGAQQIMAISTAPIVLGNMPEEGKEELYEKVAFMGQVPVKVWGTVNEDDYIIPSGFEDGTAIAVSPEMMTIEEYGKTIGRAWSSSENTMLKLINVAIGLKSGDLSHFLMKQQVETLNLKRTIDAKDEQIKKAYAELSQLKKDVAALKEMDQKLSRLEAAINRQASSSGGEQIAVKR